MGYTHGIHIILIQIPILPQMKYKVKLCQILVMYLSTRAISPGDSDIPEEVLNNCSENQSTFENCGGRWL